MPLPIFIQSGDSSIHGAALETRGPEFLDNRGSFALLEIIGVSVIID
jgi:hypothetical protein